MTTKAGSPLRARLLISLLTGCSLSAMLFTLSACSANAQSVSVEDPHIVHAPAASDADGDCIDDQLEHALIAGDFHALPNAVVAAHTGMAEIKGLGSSDATVVDVIACLNHAPTATDIATFTKLGFKVANVYSKLIYGVHLIGSVPSGAQTLKNLISQNPQLGITYIEPNHTGKELLYHSTRQIGARQSWPVFAGYNNGNALTGDPDRSICIMDTGIDGTHPDLNGGTATAAGDKIINWYDANNGNPNPNDPDGHGSHVAGIAAGTGYSSGLTSGTGTIPITLYNQFQGYIPADADQKIAIYTPPPASVVLPLPIGGRTQAENSAIPVDTTGFSTSQNLNITAEWYLPYTGIELPSTFGTTTTTSGTVNPVDISYGALNEFGFSDQAGGHAGSISGDSVYARQPFSLALPVQPGVTGTYTFDWATVNTPDQDVLADGAPVPNLNTSPWTIEALTPFTSIGDGFNLLTGVAPSSSLVGIQVSTELNGISTSAVTSGLEYIAGVHNRYNIGVVNMSFGFLNADGSAMVDDAVDTAVNNLVEDGVVVAAAAGNNRGESSTTTTTTGTTTTTTTTPPYYIGSPASASEAIAVAAVGNANEITDYSSPGVSGQDKPDVAAPGGVFLGATDSYSRNEPILSVHTNADSDFAGSNFQVENIGTATTTTTSGTTTTTTTTDNQIVLQPGQQFQPNLQPNAYTEDLGTSMASPHVAGSVALIEQAFDTPGALGGVSMAASDQAKFVKALLEMTTTVTATADLDPVTAVSGQRDTNQGFGKINTDAALEALLNSITPGDTLTGSFGTGVYGTSALAPTCVARNIALQKGTTYTFTLTGPSSADYELYLYSSGYQTSASGTATGASNGNTGDPVLLGSSTATGVTTQVVTYTPTANQTDIIVVKAVSGTGAFSVATVGSITSGTMTTTVTATPITVTVDDASTGVAIANAVVTATDATTGQQYNLGTTNTTGTITFDLPASKSVNFTASALGYFRNSSAGASAAPTATATATVLLTASHTFATGLQMISVPYGYNVAINQTTMPKLFVAAYYNPTISDYVITPQSPADTFHVGNGYWIRPRQAVSLSLQGTATSAGSTSVTLEPGWNMVGDPYTTSVALANVSIVKGTTTYSLAQAQVLGDTSPLYAYNVNYDTDQTTTPYVGASSIDPYVGYWLYAPSLETLVLPNPAT